MGNNHTFLIDGYYSYNGAKTNLDYIVCENYETYSEGTINYRKGIRNNFFVIDKEIYELGFAENEGSGWENILSLTN